MNIIKSILLKGNDYEMTACSVAVQAAECDRI